MNSQRPDEIEPIDSGALAKFHPEETKRRNAQANAVIDYAITMRDWPMLERAVTVKLDEQEQFVAWWRATVQPDGRPWPSVTGADPGRLPRAKAETQTGIPHQTVSRWAAALEDREGYASRIMAPARQLAGLDPADNHRAQGTGENEWYTPAEYLEAARAVMGGIDLDPASSEHGQKRVRAKRYFTVAEDGLTQEWSGRVWLNPPYAQPWIERFIVKWATEVEAGHLQAAIVLTHNYTDTAWFHRAEGVAARLCFTRGRIKFIDAKDQECAPTQGQAFFYVGPDPDRFAAVFGAFGFVVAPV